MAVALAAALVGLLAGCFKVDLQLTVTEDEMASGVLIAAISDATAESLGMDPADLWSQASSELDDDLPTGATVEPFAEGGFTGSRFTIPASPLGSMENSVGTDDLRIVRDGDQYVVSGGFDLRDEPDPDDTADPGDLDDLPLGMLESMEFDISVTFPGEVIETNGTADGNTARWQPKVGERNELTARAWATADGEASDGDATAGTGDTGTGDAGTSDGNATSGDGAADDGIPGWLWAVLGAVAAGVIGVIAALVARSRRSGDAAAATAYPQQAGYPSQPGHPQQPAYPAQPGQAAPDGVTPPGATPPGVTPPAPPSTPPPAPPSTPPSDPFEPPHEPGR